MALKNVTTNLIVESVNESLEFYETTLGFTKLLSVPDEGELDFAIINHGTINLMLQSKKSFNEENPVFKDRATGGTFTLYFNVDDIHALYHKIVPKTELLVDLHDTFYGTAEFTVKELNGYVLTFAHEHSQEAL
jgi:uncharacterized glyoxalase superfamily protein PhnB